MEKKQYIRKCRELYGKEPPLLLCIMEDCKMPSYYDLERNVYLDGITEISPDGIKMEPTRELW